jgi:hypothetical protein
MVELPSSAVRKITSPTAPGGRHEQMLSLVPELLGNGLPEQRVFQIFRGMYGRCRVVDEKGNPLKFD